MQGGKPTILILIGPPGSGKGTQAKHLMATYGLPQVSTGDLVRDQINRKTEIGQKLESYVNSGKFPPDKLILDMLTDRITKPDCRKGFILDGFPRNKSQAKTLDKYMMLYGVSPVVVVISVPDALLKERLLGRSICQKCHAPYHARFSPPKVEGVCDYCGGPLVQRSDDSEKVIDYRLEMYKEQTEPLIKYYEKSKRLTQIDGTQSKQIISQQITEALAPTLQS